jgi:TPR repeat protein
VAADPDEAARWLRVSGEAGDPVSQVDLANLVLDGAGSAEDKRRVAHWFERAAASGDLVAAFNLGLCLDKALVSSPTRNRRRTGCVARPKACPRPNTCTAGCWPMGAA